MPAGSTAKGHPITASTLSPVLECRLPVEEYLEDGRSPGPVSIAVDLDRGRHVLKLPPGHDGTMGTTVPILPKIRPPRQLHAFGRITEQ